MRIGVMFVIAVLALATRGYAQQPESQGTQAQAPICAGGQLSRKAINLFLARPVDEITEVRQGDQLLGQAQTQGDIIVELSPNASTAVLDVRLQGVTRLLEQPAGAAGFGKTNLESQIDARKSIVVDLNGIAARPAVADCQASLQGLTKLGFDKQGFGQRLRQGAERLASRQTEKRVQQQLDNQVDQAIEKATTRLRRQPWLPLDKASTLVEMLTFCTTSQHAQAQVLCSPDQELPAPLEVRQLDPNYDVHLMVHEALVGSLAAKWVSGKRIEDVEVLNHVERMRGRAPWALWVHARRPRWAVTLSTEEPFAIRFDENKMHIRVSISSAEYGGDMLKTPIEVSVVVEPETTSQGHRLRRSAGPAITFLDNGQDRQREEFASMLLQKFDAIFPAEVYFDGLKTPSNGAWSKFLQFEIADFSAQQGWFSLAFRLNEAKAPQVATGKPSEETATSLSR